MFQKAARGQKGGKKRGHWGWNFLGTFRELILGLRGKNPGDQAPPRGGKVERAAGVPSHPGTPKKKGGPTAFQMEKKKKNTKKGNFLAVGG